MISLVGMLFLAACGHQADVTDYVKVSFSGMDGAGRAEFSVAEDKMFEDIFDMDSDSFDKDTLKEMMQISDAYKTKMDKEKNLSNGDRVKVTVSVDEDTTDKLNGGEKVFTVKDLEEPKKLTSQDVEDKLDVEFAGANGRGEAITINNRFDSGLSAINFKVENNGKLKNGEDAKIILENDDVKDHLLRYGYVLADDFQPTVKVEGLYNIAEKATDIANLKEIKKMIEKDAKKQYDEGVFARYKIKQEKLVYRQFGKDPASDEDDDDNSDSIGTNDASDRDGNLVGIYSVTKTEKVADGEGEITDEVTNFIAIKGYSDIRLDDNNKADLSNMDELFGHYEPKYSLKSTIKKFETEGYSEVK